MAHITAPRGTADILPADSWKWQAVERIARELSALYHFAEIRTPIFEHTELFHRGVGETSDIVSKEMYTFEDRGGHSITLRPEGTAGVVRAMIEHNLLADQGARAKVFYIGPNFRFERPAGGPACGSTTSSASRHSAWPSPSRTWSASCFRWTSTAAAA